MNGIYKHFKGNEYQVYGECLDENGEKFILYKPLYNDLGYWIREYNMFFEKIKRDDNIVDRFKVINFNDNFIKEDFILATHSESLERLKIKKISRNKFTII